MGARLPHWQWRLSGLPCSPAAGLKPTDEDSPSQYAEALLGREPINRELKQFLEHSKQARSPALGWGACSGGCS